MFFLLKEDAIPELIKMIIYHLTKPEDIKYLGMNSLHLLITLYSPLVGILSNHASFLISARPVNRLELAVTF